MGGLHPAERGADEIAQFLSRLSVEKNATLIRGEVKSGKSRVRLHIGHNKELS